jgi:hypothetical protein
MFTSGRRDEQVKKKINAPKASYNNQPIKA